jgi:hypothetical protein
LAEGLAQRDNGRYRDRSESSGGRIRKDGVVADVRTALLAEMRSLLPREADADMRARLGTLSRRTPAELEALLVRVRRTGRVDEAVSWLLTAGLGLPQALFESALIMYRDSAVLSWEQCLEVARLLSWPQASPLPAWNLT